MDEQLKKDFEEAKSFLSLNYSINPVTHEDRARIFSALIIKQGLLEVAKSNEKVAEAIKSAGSKIGNAID